MLNLLFGGGLFTKVAVVLLFVALVAAAGFGVVKTGQLKVVQLEVKSLTVKIEQLTTDNATLKKNVETITQVNATNVETNNALLKERADAQAAIEALGLQKAANKRKLDAANKRIDELLKDPKNNGTVAPVLAETIKTIQEKK